MVRSKAKIDDGGTNSIQWMTGLILFAFADGAATLAGQPVEYWAGGFEAVEELNPIGAWLLGVHPAVFIAGLVIWIGVVTALLCRLPWRIGRVVACAVLLGHGLGLCSWLIQLPHGVWLVVLSLLLVRLLADAMWDGRIIAGLAGKRLDLTWRRP